MDALSDKKDGDGEKPIPQRKRATLKIKDENPETNGENLEIKDENEENLGKKRGRIKSQIVCEVCQKPMRSKHHLKVHSAVHTGEKNFVCQICKKGFQQKWNLVTHTARVHSKIKPFKCSECGKAFGYSSHFKRHVKTHFLEKIEAPDAVKKRILNPHKCEFCERCFDSNYKLDIHTKKHTGDKPFVCDKCGRAFTTRRLIAAHMARKHDMEVDFICEHCGKSFPDRSAMVLHFETGHKICDVIKESVKQKKIRKPPNKSKDKELIPCEVCGKTINRVSMNKHINIHYRNRVYKCKYCSKEFLESGQRRIHERKHTGEKPYICDVCGKGHTQYGNLMTHRKRYHNLTDRAPKLWKRTTDPEITAGLKSETEKSDPVPSEEKGENNNQENVEKSEKPPYTGDETIEEFMQKASVWIDEKFKESKPARPKRSTKKTVKEEDSSDDEGEDEDDDLPLSRLCSKNLENTKEEDCNERTKDGSDVECTGQDQISDSEDNIPELEDSNHEKSLNEKEEKYSISEQEMENFETDEDEVEFKPSITEMTINESESNRTELEPEPEPEPDPDPEPEPEPEIKKFDPKPPPNVKDVTRKMHDLIYEKIIRDLEENVEDEKLKEIVKVKITIMEDTKGNKTPLQQLLRLLQPIPDNRVTKSIGDKVFWHCWLCDSKFHNRHLLTRHLLIHEPEENRPYKCEICFKTFIQSNNYKEHVMSHKNENQYYCEKCGTGYRHKTHFNKHLRKHNPEMIDPRPKNFKCSYCDKRFATTFHKTEHERKHTNERPYLCKNCGRQFGTLSTLNKHMQVHAAAKHQCNICLKFFRHRYSLKRHHRTHSYNPEQRVHCECGQSFSQKPSLFRHKLICEFNEEPAPKAFECSLCSKKFGGKHDLKRHEATHETSKKFKCPICSTRCKTRETYKRHLRRHNKPNKPTTLENDFDCDECQFTSGVVKEIVRHIIQTHLNWVQNDLDD